MQNDEFHCEDEGYSEAEDVAWQRHPAISYAQAVPAFAPLLETLSAAWDRGFNRYLSRGRWIWSKVGLNTPLRRALFKTLFVASETLLRAEYRIILTVLSGAVLKYRANIHCRALLDSWRA